VWVAGGDRGTLLGPEGPCVLWCCALVSVVVSSGVPVGGGRGGVAVGVGVWVLRWCGVAAWWPGSGGVFVALLVLGRCGVLGLVCVRTVLLPAGRGVGARGVGDWSPPVF